MTINTSITNDEKLAELMLYISMKSESDETFGATKLNKLLFYADFIAYLKLKKPITGAEYQCIERGPAPRSLLPIRRKLVNPKMLQLDQQIIMEEHKIDLSHYANRNWIFLVVKKLPW